MTEHTPTPWEINPVRTVENTVMITGGEGFDFGLIADVTEESDAAFIIEAANNHNALVGALLEIAAFPDGPQSQIAKDVLALVTKDHNTK